jgi:hypothetical protein
MAKYSNTKGLIVDVRDNAGGSIRRASAYCNGSLHPGRSRPPLCISGDEHDLDSAICRRLSANWAAPGCINELVDQAGVGHRRDVFGRFQYTTKAQCNSDDRIVFPPCRRDKRDDLEREVFAAGFRITAARFSGWMRLQAVAVPTTGK